MSERLGCLFWERCGRMRRRVRRGRGKGGRGECMLYDSRMARRARMDGEEQRTSRWRSSQVLGIRGQVSCKCGERGGGREGRGVYPTGSQAYYDTTKRHVFGSTGVVKWTEGTTMSEKGGREREKPERDKPGDRSSPPFLLPPRCAPPSSDETSRPEPRPKLLDRLLQLNDPRLLHHIILDQLLELRRLPLPRPPRRQRVLDPLRRNRLDDFLRELRLARRLIRNDEDRKSVV